MENINHPADYGLELTPSMFTAVVDGKAHRSVFRFFSNFSFFILNFSGGGFSLNVLYCHLKKQSVFSLLLLSPSPSVCLTPVTQQIV